MTTIGRRPSASALREHEARLGHRALHRIDEQQAAIGHVEHALDLAAEVGVAGRVDDVDLDVAVDDGSVLGEDGDAALALEIVGVHDQFADHLVVAELFACLSMPSTSVVLP